MTPPTFQVGDRLTTGTFLRYLPNWETHWDYDVDVPKPRAFRKRRGEDELSMFHEGLTDINKLSAAFPDFGICRISVAELLEGTDAYAEYSPDPNHPEGHAHFSVRRLPKGKARWLAYGGATIVKKPGKAAVPADPSPQDDAE